LHQPQAEKAIEEKHAFLHQFRKKDIEMDENVCKKLCKSQRFLKCKWICV